MSGEQTSGIAVRGAEIGPDVAKGGRCGFLADAWHLPTTSAQRLKARSHSSRGSLGGDLVQIQAYHVLSGLLGCAR
jgi:hypothetical protein